MFRAPTNSSLLAVYVGTGSQLLGMALVTMVFAVLGFLSPANRGGLMTAMLLLFAFMGIVGGYFSGRLYKRFKVRPSCGTQLAPPSAGYFRPHSRGQSKPCPKLWLHNLYQPWRLVQERAAAEVGSLFGNVLTSVKL